MRFLKFSLAFFFVAGCCAAPSFAQTSQWYFGTGIGAQQWRGPLNASLGMGGEILLGRTFSRHGALVLTAGYASLPFQQSSLQNGIKFTLVTREANLFYGDVLFELHPFGRHTVSPYVALGGGLLNVQVGSATRKNYPAGIIAGGLQLRLNKDLVFHLAGKYHHLVEGALEGFDAGKTPEGYFGARVGLIFSSAPNKNENDADWFTTLDAETSPFAEQTQPEVASNTAPAETSAVKTEAPSDKAAEDNFETEEEPAVADTEAPPDLNEAPTPPPVADTAAVLAHANHADDGDPFSRFNRKLEMLEKESTALPAPSNKVEALLEDEPPFESFYPVNKPEETRNLQQPLSDQEEEPSLEPPAGAVSTFEERLAKLDEEEDFLSPATPLADAPVETFDSENEAASMADDEPHAEPIVLPQAERAPEINEASATSSMLDSRLRALDERFESTPEVSPPQPSALEQPQPARANVPPPGMANGHNTVEARKQPAPAESMTNPPAPVYSKPAASAKTASPSSQPQRSSAAPQPRPAEDQELRELRALLDRLEGGTSHFGRDSEANANLALHEDREVVELRRRLDDLTAGERFAQKSSPPSTRQEEGNTSPAYEAFKDRLGLMQEQPQSLEDEEWDQRRLKSQINSIDKELAQKDEDISAIRTALAQSAANGAAFPASPAVTRGSFAHGYEGALNSFYMQRHAEAIGKFSRLIEQYPAHTLTSNCYYWLGEAQFGHGDYQAALVSFNRVLAFERSLKKDNALLMLGKTYMALQRPNDARAAFNRLTSEYPFSDAVTKAQELMKSM